MALSYVTAVGDGATETFAVPFPYISRSHIQLTVDGTPTAFTWDSDTVVRVSPAPAAAAVVIIKRVSSWTERLVDYTPGVLTEESLDTDSLQGFYIAQEVIDALADTLHLDLATFTLWDADGKRIQNVADPVDGQDAATKAWVDSTTSTSAAAAAASEAAAAASEAAAAASEAAAASYATSANTANDAAQAAQVAVAAAYDSFDDRYLGPKASHPTLDNDGDPLVAGTLYFNTSTGAMYVYDGASWKVTAAESTLTEYEYTATAGQTTFSGGGLSYKVGLVMVAVNGVMLPPSDYTATSGTSVVLDTGVSDGDNVTVYVFQALALGVDKVDVVTGTIGNVPTITTGGQLTDSGKAIADLKGATDDELAQILQNSILVDAAKLDLVAGVADGYWDDTGLVTSNAKVSAYSTLVQYRQGLSNHYDYVMGSIADGYRDTAAQWFGDGQLNAKNMGNKIRPVETFTLSTVKIGVGNVTTSFVCKASVYTDSAGFPGTLIADADATVNLNTADTDYTFTWTAGPTLNAGTDYWIVLQDTTASGKVGIKQRMYDVNGIDSNVINWSDSTLLGVSQIGGANDVITSIVGGTAGGGHMEIPTGLSVVTSTTESVTVTAAAQPDIARIYLSLYGNPTLNTDLKVWASRDGGTTWTLGTLTRLGVIDNPRIAVASIDISAQPAGTSMRYKIEQGSGAETLIDRAFMWWG